MKTIVIAALMVAGVGFVAQAQNCTTTQFGTTTYTSCSGGGRTVTCTTARFGSSSYTTCN